MYRTVETNADDDQREELSTDDRWRAGRDGLKLQLSLVGGGERKSRLAGDTNKSACLAFCA